MNKYIHELKIKNITLKNNLILAPLAGYTNKVYRNMCRDSGASLAYTEMISSKGLLFENDKTIDMAMCDLDNGYTSVQLFGYDIDEMVKAAKMVEERCKCDIIDINMGCPVKKVIKSQSGAYAMTDEEHSHELVKAITKNVKIPVTVKIRLGWDHNNINCVRFAKLMEEAGASAIAIHGRCKSDMYTGKINLEYIKQVKEAINIPVIGNGDIKNYEDAKRFFDETGVDALMIGRGSFGNPWIFEEILAGFSGIEYKKKTLDEKLDFLKKKVEELIELKGEYIAILEMRTMASWYVKGYQNVKEFREKVTSVKTKEELFDCINWFKEKAKEGKKNED